MKLHKRVVHLWMIIICLFAYICGIVLMIFNKRNSLFRVINSSLSFKPRSFIRHRQNYAPATMQLFVGISPIFRIFQHFVETLKKRVLNLVFYPKSFKLQTKFTTLFNMFNFRILNFHLFHKVFLKAMLCSMQLGYLKLKYFDFDMKYLPISLYHVVDLYIMQLSCYIVWIHFHGP